LRGAEGRGVEGREWERGRTGREKGRGRGLYNHSQPHAATSLVWS